MSAIQVDRMSRCGDMAIQNYPRWYVACRQLGFDIGNSDIRSADPENPILEPNIKCIGDMAIRVSWGISNPHFGEGEVVGVWHHSKERRWFPIGSPL